MLRDLARPDASRPSKHEITQHGPDDRHRQPPGQQLVEERAALVAATPARHSAPIVESGDTSTRCPPMFIDVAMAIALAPGSAAARPGTIGRNAGSTTPDVLL